MYAPPKTATQWRTNFCIFNQRDEEQMVWANWMRMSCISGISALFSESRLGLFKILNLRNENFEIKKWETWNKKTRILKWKHETFEIKKDILTWSTNYQLQHSDCYRDFWMCSTILIVNFMFWLLLTSWRVIEQFALRVNIDLSVKCLQKTSSIMEDIARTPQSLGHQAKKGTRNKEGFVLEGEVWQR